MSTFVIRKRIMGAVSALGVAFLVVGIWTNSHIWSVLGLLQLIVSALWLYGQTLSKD